DFSRADSRLMSSSGSETSMSLRLTSGPVAAAKGFIIDSAPEVLGSPVETSQVSCGAYGNACHNMGRADVPSKQVSIGSGRRKPLPRHALPVRAHSFRTAGRSVSVQAYSLLGGRIRTTPNTHIPTTGSNGHHQVTPLSLT